ncbi:MAG: bacillithiol biosynthesis cysteine-adding enzyme BshC [Planctomycetota bacterium]|nr:bacillithiol biosynthesis cysteine-adding enzyme BshC [Planctomycetota bacterium]
MPATILGTVPYAAAGFGGRLCADLAGDFARVKPFFRRDPRSESDWNALFEELDTHAHPRAELAAILARACAEFGQPDEAHRNAARLAEPKTYAILTGQQAGLFGGPLYSLFKALTAVRWARELEARHGPARRFVPVFWVASDDHDLDEVDHAYLLDADARLQRLKVEIPADLRGRGAGDVSVAGTLEALRAPLEALLPGAAGALLAPYRARNLGGAFAELLSGWLGALGLVVVESTALRPLGRDLFARELAEFEASNRLVREAGERMLAAGYEPGFEPRGSGAPAPHLFEHRDSGRARIAAGNAAGLREAAAREPGRFSPGAALRPVLQQLAFPVAAAVLGPGELAYWAQLPELHDRYGAVWPMLVPRATFTLLDGKVAKARRRLDAAPADLFLPWDELRAKYLSGGALGARLDAGAERMLAEFDALHAEVRARDQGLEPLFAKARQRIEGELARVGEKVKANEAERGDSGLTRLTCLAESVRPKGRPQERTLCAAAFAARDPGLGAALLEVLDPLVFAHAVVELS